MTTLAVAAFGTLLKMGDGATPENFTTIAEVRDIGGMDLKLDTADVTNHSSTDGWAEEIPTILSAGPVKFKINWIPSGATHSYATGLVHDLVNRHLRNYQLVIPTVAPVTWAFSGFVVGFATSQPVAKELSADVTINITGKPTLA